MTTIIGALIGGLFASLGWFVNFVLNERAKRRLLEAELLRKRYQEFYLPLFNLARRSRDIYELMDRERKSNRDRWEDITRFHTSRYLRPIQSQIRELIESKRYLAFAPAALPKGFHDFLKHEAQTGIQVDLWMDRGIPGITETVDYPKRLLNDIETDLIRSEDEYRSNTLKTETVTIK